MRDQRSEPQARGKAHQGEAAADLQTNKGPGGTITMPHRDISCIVILREEDNAVLLQDRTGISKFGEEWTIFGGGVEQGETFEQAFAREAMEELKLDVTTVPYSLIGTYEEAETNLKGEFWTLKAKAFLMRLTQTQIDSLVQCEGQGMRIASFDEAEQLRIGPFDRRIIADLKKLHPTPPQS